MSDSFEVITSLRCDRMLLDNKQNAAYAPVDNHKQCPFFLLSLHRDRMIEACEAFGRKCEYLKGTAGLANLERQLQDHLATDSGEHGSQEPLKVKGKRHKCSRS